jgi:hypothetical protein
MFNDDVDSLIVRIRDMMQPEESAEKAKSMPEMRTFDAQGSLKPVACGQIVAEYC